MTHNIFHVTKLQSRAHLIMLVIMWGHREGEKKREKLSPWEGNVSQARPAVAVREYDVHKVFTGVWSPQDLEWTRPELWLKSEKRPEKQNVTSHPAFGLFWRFLPAATQNKTAGINAYFPTKVSVWIVAVFCFFKWNLQVSSVIFHSSDRTGGITAWRSTQDWWAVDYCDGEIFNSPFLQPGFPWNSLIAALALGGWLLSIALQLCSKADSFHFYWHFNEL